MSDLLERLRRENARLRKLLDLAVDLEVDTFVHVRRGDIERNRWRVEWEEDIGPGLLDHQSGYTTLGKALSLARRIANG